MAAPVIPPNPQFCDADGNPYAAGTLDTFAVASSVRKLTWQDPGLRAANTNPIVLDSAGRCLLWGDGDYRLVLRDSVGNLIFDQPATTIVSAAMAPVVSAPTLADARTRLGVDAAIAAEAAARTATDNALTASIATTNTNLAHEATDRNNSDVILAAAISTETTNRTNADTNLQNQINAITGSAGLVVVMQTGTGTSSATGAVNVTFPVPYATRTINIQIYGGVTYPNAYYQQTVVGGVTGALTLTAATGNLMNDTAGVPNVLTNQPFTYYVTGH